MISNTDKLRCEINCDAIDRRVPNLDILNTLASKYHCPAIVVMPDLFSLVQPIKLHRSAKYDVIVKVDPEGKKFGVNKILQHKDVMGADGFDIGLSKGYNSVELFNEITTITSTLFRLGNYKIRWIINFSFGEEHVNNSLWAIKEFMKKNPIDVIRVIAQDKEKSIKKVRSYLGRQNIKIKINGYLDADDNNLLYDVEVNDIT